MNARQHEALRLPLPAGGQLVGSLSYSDSPGSACVLYVHGFGSTRAGEKAEALEAACARRGWTYAAVDFRGHGGSPGTMLDLRGSALQEDLGRLRDHLAELGVHRLFPVGSSMGGWAGAWFALRHRESVPACAVVAPAFRFLEHRWEELDEAPRADWQRTGRHRYRNQWLDVELGFGLMEERDRFAFERLTAEWSTPLLIFHGMHDETVPYTDSLEFARRAAFGGIELRLFKSGDHRLLAFKDELAEGACAFFARHWEE
jgi:pimeloyl-ACP methyl ester carboxylesterase